MSMSIYWSWELITASSNEYFLPTLQFVDLQAAESSQQDYNHYANPTNKQLMLNNKHTPLSFDHTRP